MGLTLLVLYFFGNEPSLEQKISNPALNLQQQQYNSSITGKVEYNSIQKIV